MDELPVRGFPDKASWREWLAEHHAESPGTWLKIAKRGSPTSTVNYADALEVALCYGWIDSQKAAFDEQFFLQRFTPRKAGSKWSVVNRKKAEELISSGEMRPAGLREVERARSDGRWERAYEGQRSAAVPEDLQAALDADPAAKAFFESLDRANRYAVLYRVEEARRPDTRARRIQHFVSMLAEGRKLHP